MRVRLTLLTLAVCSLPAAAGIISTFNSGSEGWTVAGDGPDTSVTYISSGCHPGGCIQRADLTPGYMHFSAPAAFLGDLSAYRGGVLSYDLLQTTPSADTSWFYRLVIQGNGLYLLSTVELPPNTTSWIHISTALLPANFIVIPTLEDYIGAAATQAQLDAVMAGVTGVFITGDLISGDRTTGSGDVAFLDNVALDVPEPATTVLTAAGLLLLFWRAARRSAGMGGRSGS